MFYLHCRCNCTLLFLNESGSDVGTFSEGISEEEEEEEEEEEGVISEILGDEKMQGNVSLCESGVLTEVFYSEGRSPGISPP